MTLSGPWQNYPFQYSLHILEADGTVSHREYLHEDQTDPRPPLARSLCRAIGPTGTLVAYNAAFEKSTIASLASFLPEHRRDLDAMIPRFFDLLVIFREHYAHPDFLGSNSIKHVLPVLVPELSYDHLAVADGQQAQTAWTSLIGTAPGGGADTVHKHSGHSVGQATFGFEREATIAQLKEYCRLETLAMLRIHEELRRL